MEIEEKEYVMGLEKGLAIIEAFGQRKGPMTLTQAAEGDVVTSLATATLNTSEAAVSRTLGQAQACADALTNGQQVQDVLTVSSFDSTASYNITVDITGSNDAASITASWVISADSTSIGET